MVSIFLVNFYTRLNDHPSKFSLASMRLAAYIANVSDLDIKILNFGLKQNEQEIASKLIDLRGDIIGFPVYMWTIKKSQIISWLVKKNCRDSLIVIGGPETAHLDVSKWPDGTLFILGEGEVPLKWICEQRKHNSELGLSEYNGGLHEAIYSQNKPRAEAKKVITSSLPEGVPLFSQRFLQTIKGDDLIANRAFTWYDTARGCPYRCGYCGHRTRPRVATYSLKLIKEEIKNIGKLGFKEVYIIDPTLGGLPGRDGNILKLFQRYAPKTKIRAFYRPEFLNDESISILQNSNISELLIGIQTTNPNVPRWIRSNDFKKINTFLPKLTKLRIPWRAELIIGLPGDTYNGLKESLRLVIEKLIPKLVRAYHLTVIRGTKVHDILNKTEEELWVRADPVRLRATESSSYSKKEMDKMLIYATAITSLYNVLKEQEGTRNTISFNKLDGLVRLILSTSGSSARDIFKSQSIKESKNFWQKELNLTL